ncbi:MAG TPA: hypothetical protein VF546_05450 [Pyrinomonadaceae bacterium]|jgi:hypothetical protein
MSTTPITPRFPLGQLVTTPGALDAMLTAGDNPAALLARHADLEQGALSDADHRENLFSVDKRLRIFSAFLLRDGAKVWIITEADRSATTILLPEEY